MDRRRFGGAGDPVARGAFVRPLGELEAEIMNRLWTWGRPATARDVLVDLGRTRSIAYSTVKTVAEILHRKGLLRREKQGRAWLYEPTCTRQQYTASLMQDALGDNPDPAGALLSFVERMSADEVEALRSALRAAKRRSGT
jgi:predicted transcriptional regulator